MHLVLNMYTFLMVLSLVLGCLAIPPIPARFNLLAASWVAFLVAQFFLAR